MRTTCTLVVRGQDRATLERRTKRLRQRVKDLGAELRLLRWEQRAGWLAIAPLRPHPLSRRGQPVETGTVARTYPFSAGTLVIEGGVPFGVAASAPVTFTTAAPCNKNRHCCWYGTSGAGKGYSLRVLLSREHFANGLRIYGIDQDEQQEYAGRFCAYLGGTAVPIRTLADAQAFHFLEVASPDVVLWDLHDSDEGDRGAIFAALKAHLVTYLLEHPGRAAFIVDEVVTVTEDDLGARTLGDLVRRGRHFGLEVHVLTQRVTDWFDSRIGRTIQSVGHPSGSDRWRRANCTRSRPAWGSRLRNATASKGRPGRGAARDDRPACVGQSVRTHLAWGIRHGQYRRRHWY